MFTCTLLWCPSQPLFHILGWLFQYFWIMKMPTFFLITSKMFELGSSASHDPDMLLVLCVIAEVSCPMPSGNRDTLEVMPGSSSRQAKCLNQPHFYFTFRKHCREKEEKKNNFHERKPASLYLNWDTTESKCPQQRGNFLSEKMQNAESRWQGRQMLKPNINGCLKKHNADGWVDRC